MTMSIFVGAALGPGVTPPNNITGEWAEVTTLVNPGHGHHDHRGTFVGLIPTPIHMTEKPDRPDEERNRRPTSHRFFKKLKTY